MKKTLRARSPAKLILSGEHAVVYGKPAVAMAIDRYAESMVLSSLSSAIIFNCRNFKYAKSFTMHALQALKARLQEQYHAFLEDRCCIREVLKKPFELLQYTVTSLLETWSIPLSEGLEIRSSSNIPIGCGMGSSAAVVMSALYALAHFFKLEIDPVRYLSLGREVENLQHGYSSGVDLTLALSGGCLRFEEGRALKRAIPRLSMSMVQTGQPEVSTGECVSFVAKHFKKSDIWHEFAGVTETLDQALQADDRLTLRECIRQNHQLLIKIGVVPERVQAFIRAIEQAGGAAKICGSGAIAGDKAGVVLLVADQDLSSIARAYGYPIQPIQGDSRGTYIL